MKGITCPKCGSLVLKRAGRGNAEYFCPNCNETFEWNDWAEYLSEINDPVKKSIAETIQEALTSLEEKKESFNPSFRKRKKKDES